jgi:benzoyl-CoA reductase/2-hydroxyglutaryl-CoA dehydratase subunit BcrC/BadD/HgdB
MLAQYFSGMVSAFETRFQRHPTARGRFTLEILRLGKRLYSGEDRLAWCGVCVPFDLLHAMGINSCFVEFIGGVLSSTGKVGPFLEEAEHAGFLADGCAYHRAVIGAAAKGMVPPPDFVIATSSPCTGGSAAVENLARMFDRPLFVLNVPPDGSDAGIEFVARQLRNMVDFITEHTGRTLDRDRLSNAIELTNKAREALVDVFEMAKRVPSPASVNDLRNFGILMPLFLGIETGVEIAEAYRNEFASRIDRGISGVPNEQFRLMWLQNCIQFKNPLIAMLEENYGATIVSDELNDIFWEPIDPDDPYTGLARRTVSFPLNGLFPYRLRHIEKLARQYNIDGVINPCHWGCRQGAGSRGLMTTALKERGVPVINLEVDCVDSRNFSEGQLRTRLEAFMELLMSRRSLAQ